MAHSEGAHEENPLRLGGILWRGAAAAAVIATWWFVSALYGNLVPTPWLVVREAYGLVAGGAFAFHMVQTLRRVFVGFLIAMMISFPVGVVMGSLRPGRQFFEPIVVVGLTIPGVMWAFISIMLFGLSEVSPYFAIAITIAPMLIINVWQGVGALDRDLIDMSTAFHASRLSKTADVILPHLAPYLLAAARYGLGLAWKVVVVVEMFGMGNGVGYQVMRAYQVFSMQSVLAWTVMFVLAMVIIEYGIIGLVERWATAWRPRVQVWRR